MANNPKLENVLNLTLDTPPSEWEKSPELSTGFDAATRRWEVIVRYANTLDRIRVEFPDIQIIELYGNYAIFSVPQAQLDALAAIPDIVFIEKPKRLFFAVDNALRAACVTGLSDAPDFLTGKDILIGVIDSGIDYTHPDFRNPDGSTRILRLWDQTIPPTGDVASPESYPFGSEYTKERIDLALSQPTDAKRRELCPSIDRSGHGTHVTGIAAGNGRASDGRFRGVAPESPLIIVKLGNPQADAFPYTTQLMTAVDYIVRFAAEARLPVALNLSFGNNFGSHSGTSLLESYLNTVSEYGRTTLVIGSGNEGLGAGHASATFRQTADGQWEAQSIAFSVGPYETSFSIQIWKNYADTFDVVLISPSGRRIGPFQEVLGSQTFQIGQTTLLFYFGEPSPYSIYQELYLEFLPSDTYIESGIWTFEFLPHQIKDGSFDLWMPGKEFRGGDTAFLIPSVSTTLTIPSTAMQAITVGAYDSIYDQLADFSGRGYTWQTNFVKPTLAAPGVSITSCAPGGGYTTKSGTSMATPFVTGAAALLMQYGITDQHDPFLYGQKVKASLIRGARPLPVLSVYPNPLIGWGVLCVRDSF
ncbi:MAG: S8 family peptidase [Lachnospiraceae bacterium]